ncbi:MAG: RluA family pseudouridine synthase, partial [Alphaproteobacteria bacterium]
GEIRVDGGRVKPATRLEAGQRVRVPPLPEPESSARPAAPRLSEADVKMIGDAVLYRDAEIIAINKPAGLPTQGGTGQGNRHVDALAEALRFELDEKPRLVHRLDKDTSGVLLMARSRSVAKALTDAFRARDTRKIYWALVAGVPQPRMGTVNWGLVKAPGHGAGGEGEKMRCVHPAEVARTPGAKRAVTDYAVIQPLANRAAWVALVPVTGRTHQLRAHMAEMGHPIIGDGKYGGSGQENLGDGWGAMLGGEISRKLHLHARSLAFTHPLTGRRVTITAPLPAHMAKTWAMLGFDERDAPEDPFEEDGAWR